MVMADKKSVRVAFGALLLVVAGGCMKQPLVDGGSASGGERVPIELVTSPSGTKGLGNVTTESLRSDTFGVFGFYRDAGDVFDGVDVPHRLLDNARMGFIETKSGGDRWRVDPVVYWPLGCSMTFFAYAPYMSHTGPVLTLPNDDGNPMLRGTFSVPSDPKAQPDFCLSAPVMDWTVSQGDVPVEFEHTLTRVKFYFNLTGSPYEGDYRVYRVKSLSLDGVVGTNKFTYGGTNGWSWDDLPRNNMALRTASYDLSLAEGTLNGVDLPYEWDRSAQSGLAKYECVNEDPDGVLYLLPQPVTTAASVTVQVAAYMDDGTGNWVEDTRAEIDPLTVPLPEATVWHAGETVCYSATIDMSWLMELVFSVTVTPWSDEAKTAFIPAERQDTGSFSVSDTKKVRFSTGNLQAVLSGGKLAETSYVAHYWRFAKNQWDRIGKTEGNTSFAAGSVVDLFSWIGESGAYDSFGLCTDETADDTSGDPIHGTSMSEGLKTDWGSVPGVISSLGSGWRTLSFAEWNYLVQERASGATVNGVGNARFTLATIRTDVSGVRGAILFPDGVTVAAGEATAWGDINAVSAWATTCTADQWTALEAKGCVFLPTGGYRYGLAVSGQNSYCAYWTSSPRNVASKLSNSITFRFNSTVGQYNRSRMYGFPVRLVRDADGDVEPVPVPVDPSLEYFYVEAVSAGSVTSTKDCSWSRDLETWTTYSGTISVSAGDKVYFKATSASWTGQHIKSSAAYKVGGNISSLLVGDDFPTSGAAGLTDYTFCDFFNGDTNITDASALVLPMTQTYNSSFKSMFHGATSLVHAPALLPATSLGNQSYRNMFNGCVNLEDTPVMVDSSVKSGASGVYSNMFTGCSKVTSITCLTSWYSSGQFGSWVSGVNGTGQFTKKSTTVWDSGTSGIPSGWSVNTQ